MAGFFAMLISLFVVEPADMQDRLEFHHNRQLAELSPVISKVTLERLRSRWPRMQASPPGFACQNESVASSGQLPT